MSTDSQKESDVNRGSDPPGNQAHFATTHWSMVLAAGNENGSGSRRALEQLCQQYWYPLYAFLRRRGTNRDQAQELTQAFFVHLLEKKSYEKADPERGRFRTFLITAINNFVANYWRAENAAKRSPQTKLISLEFDDGERRYSLEPQDDTTPEKLFERRWGLTVLQNAMDRLQNSYEQEGKLELFNALKPLIVGGADSIKQQDLAYELGLSHGALRVALHRMRKKCRDTLREEIAQTVESANDIDKELRYLLDVITG